MTLHRLSGMVGWCERHPAQTFVAIGLLFALAYVTPQVWLPNPPGRIIDGMPSATTLGCGPRFSTATS